MQQITATDPLERNEDRFGEFYVVLKLGLKEKSYECVYSHKHAVYEEVKKAESYDEFMKMYVEEYVHADDKDKVLHFLLSDGLTENLVNGCAEKDIIYRRLNDKKEKSYIWMKAKKYVDVNDDTAIVTLHNLKKIYHMMVNMKKELKKREKDLTDHYWNMVSLLSTVLDHNNLVESVQQDNMIFFTKQIYQQLQKDYPEYGIADEEIEAVSHLAPIHDIGKISVPMEILNKKGKLSTEEMDVVKHHPLTGAEMTRRFPKGFTTEVLNEFSYEICRHHHERYDGSGYPDGLIGDEILLCAQVVGLADAYDALISVRPYKRKMTHEEAVQMIINGECGAFSDSLLHCFQKVAMREEWVLKAI